MDGLHLVIEGFGIQVDPRDLLVHLPLECPLFKLVVTHLFRQLIELEEAAVTLFLKEVQLIKPLGLCFQFLSQLINPQAFGFNPIHRLHDSN